jgi:hypothetical protein
MSKTGEYISVHKYCAVIWWYILEKTRNVLKSNYYVKSRLALNVSKIGPYTLLV